MREKLITMLDAADEDVDYSYYNGAFHVTLFDFEGFDEDWNEIMRDFTHEEEVDALLAWLDQNCVSCTHNYYTTYHFSNFDVEVGYSSMDI